MFGSAGKGLPHSTCRPPRRELAAIYHAEVSADLNLVVSDELTDLRWISLSDPPAGTALLDLAIAPWAIHGADVHG